MNDQETQYSPGATRALVLLTAAYALAFLDRQVIAILQEQIKHDLSLSDTELGLLTGFSFAVFYALFGIAIGRIADRWIRRDVVAASIGLWSIPTALSGAAAGFGGLLVARICVAVGEAGCIPASYSLLSDIFPVRRRASAISIFNTGANWGMLLGFLVGGWVGQAAGWRISFAIVGLPGLFLALAIRKFLYEPVRGVARDQQGAPSISVGIALLVRSRTMWLLFGAAVTGAIAAYAPVIWGASYFARTYGLGLGAAGTWLALVMGVGGMLSALSVGLVSDRVSQKKPAYAMLLCAALMVVVAGLFLALFLAPSLAAALVVGVVPFAAAGAYTAPAVALLHRATEPRFRATVSAIYLLCTNILGMGAGTWTIGIVSDALSPRLHGAALGAAMSWIVPIAALVSGLLFLGTAWSLQTEGHSR